MNSLKKWKRTICSLIYFFVRDEVFENVLGFGLGLEAQILGLGLEAYKSSKMFCPRFEDSIIFYLVEKENNRTKNDLNF